RSATPACGLRVSLCMLPNRRSVFSGRCGRLSLSFGSATLGLGRLVRPFHPGLSVWVTVHVFVLSFMFSLGGTFTLRAARLSLAHRIWIPPPERRTPVRPGAHGLPVPADREIGAPAAPVPGLGGGSQMRPGISDRC